METVPDGENIRPAAKRARSTTQQVRGAILEHQASINERLVEARARDEQFRTDIRDGLSALAKSMATLGDAMRTQMERDAENRRIEVENRARDAERMNQMLLLLSTSVMRSGLPANPQNAPNSTL